MKRLLCAFALLLAMVSVCAEASAEEPAGRMALSYAERFSVDYYEGGAVRLGAGEQAFLLLPAGARVP